MPQQRFVLLSTQWSGTHFFMSTLRTRTPTYAYDEIFFEHAPSRKSSDDLLRGLAIFFGLKGYAPNTIHDAIGYGKSKPLREMLSDGSMRAFAARGCTVHYNQGPLFHWAKFAEFLAANDIALVHLVRRDAVRGAVSKYLLTNGGDCVPSAREGDVRRSARKTRDVVARVRRDLAKTRVRVLDAYYEDLAEGGGGFAPAAAFLGVALEDATGAVRAKLHPATNSVRAYFETDAGACPWKEA